MILQRRALKSRARLLLAANLRTQAMLDRPLVLILWATMTPLLLVRLPLLVRPLFPLLSFVLHRHSLAMAELAAPHIAHLVAAGLVVLSEVVLESVVLEEVVVEEVIEEEVVAEDVEEL